MELSLFERCSQMFGTGRLSWIHKIAHASVHAQQLKFRAFTVETTSFKWSCCVFIRCFVLFFRMQVIGLVKRYTERVRNVFLYRQKTTCWHLYNQQLIFQFLYERVYVFSHAHWINYGLIFRTPETYLRTFENQTPENVHCHLPHLHFVELCFWNIETRFFKNGIPELPRAPKINAIRPAKNGHLGIIAWFLLTRVGLLHV